MQDQTPNASPEQAENVQDPNQSGHKDHEGQPVSDRRFKDVYGKWKGQERENAALQEELAEVKTMLSSMNKPQEKPLTPEAFDYDDEALNNAKMQQMAQQIKQEAIQEFQSQQQQFTAQQQQEAAINSYVQKADEYGKQNPEFVHLFEQAANAGIQIRPDIGSIISSLDNGPAIHHELLRNPQLMQNLNQMDAGMANFQLGQIASNLSKPEISKAPDPIEPVRGGGVNTTPPSTMKEKAAAWKAKGGYVMPSQRK